MYEQRLCAQMKDCGDNTYKNENGEDLYGWCYMGRNGDGEGEGMVRKGGSGTDQNETKYLDDYNYQVQIWLDIEVMVIKNMRN